MISSLIIIIIRTIYSIAVYFLFYKLTNNIDSINHVLFYGFLFTIISVIIRYSTLAIGEYILKLLRSR